MVVARAEGEYEVDGEGGGADGEKGRTMSRGPPATGTHETH